MLFVKKVMIKDPFTGHAREEIRSAIEEIGNGASLGKKGYVPACSENCKTCNKYKKKICTDKDKLIRKWAKNKK